MKQGVYEEYVTITRAMENVTMYGDGAMKTIITGSKNFADGLTTYKTATFSKTRASPFATPLLHIYPYPFCVHVAGLNL